MPPLACLDGHVPLIYNLLNDSSLPIPDEGSKGWGTAKSSSLYRIDGWGAPYFFINGKGNMAVRPHGKATVPGEEIDIMLAVQKIVESRALGGLGLSLPLIVRFPDVLKNIVDTLQSAFEHGIKVHNYKGRFQGVFPVKCNQDRYVVENIVEFGRPHDFGLEAGSKPELLMAMSCLCKGSSEALLICNGYKDPEYVGLALMARQIGFNCVVVLEQEDELEVVTRMSRHLCIQPVIGLRAKLNTKHEGHFGGTSGEKGKFGLSSSEMVRIVQKLRRVGMLECLQLLHFHIGSQIPSLAVLNDGVSEAAHIYCELALMGAGMRYIDIGGGLGIDYDGSNSEDSDMSVGYSTAGYAREVVKAVKEACLLKNVKQPILCSESGRALVSHHSVLVFDVLSAEQKGRSAATDLGVPLEVEGLPEELGCVCRRMAIYARTGDYESALVNAKQMKLECTDLFKQGKLSLMQLGAVSSIYEVLTSLVEERQRENMERIPLSLKLMDPSNHGGNEHNAIYHANLSIFKSMPDTWAIGQLFPIVPVHRLDEKPSLRAILSDLTCDSDGKISTFIQTDPKGNRLHYLPVHALEADKPYIMGMFLGGAYQEALGGMHNLFGNPGVVHVTQSSSSNGCGGGGGFKITRVIAGQTAADVLRCMQHEPHAMLEQLKLRVKEALHEGRFGEDDDDDDDGDAAATSAATEAAKQLFESLAMSFGSPTYLSNVSRSCFCHSNSMVVGSALEQAYCCT